MAYLVDVQIPIRHNGKIPGLFLARLLSQGVGFRLWIKAGPDTISSSDEGYNKVHNIAHKRQFLRNQGNYEFIYMADDNLILPNFALLAQYAEVLSASSSVCMIGTFYRDHVACGSMLLRRKMLDQFVPTIIPCNAMCECNFIADHFMKEGYMALLSTGDGCHHMEGTPFDVACCEPHVKMEGTDHLTVYEMEDVNALVEKYGESFSLTA